MVGVLKNPHQKPADDGLIPPNDKDFQNCRKAAPPKRFEESTPYRRLMVPKSMQRKRHEKPHGQPLLTNFSTRYIGEKNFVGPNWSTMP